MTTVVFQCCQPCRDGSCGVDCDHVTRDQQEYGSVEEAMATQHEGCGCVVEPLKASAGQLDSIARARIVAQAATVAMGQLTKAMDAETRAKIDQLVVIPVGSPKGWTT